MTVDIVIPFSSNDPDRLAALKWLTVNLRHPTRVGACPEPWVKAAAVADAAAGSTADIIVIHDADVWCDNLDAAINAVADGAPWAMPHHRVHRLTPAATSAWYQGYHVNDVTERPYPGTFGGGIVALSRSTYHDIPLDGCFQGWGQEDHSWGRALDLLAGPCHRGEAPLFHLWHQPAPRLTRSKGTSAGSARAARYDHAHRTRDTAAMRRLLDEAKEATWTRHG